MIWVCSDVYYPDQSATSHFMTGLAEGLSKTLEVGVICSQPASGMKLPRHHVHNGAHIHRCSSIHLNKNNYLFRLVNFISFCLSAFFVSLVRIKKKDKVLVVTNPPILPFVISLVCWIKGAVCVLRVDDVYPEAMVRAGMLAHNSPAVTLLNFFTKYLYRSVRIIIALGRDMKTLIDQKLPPNDDRSIVITNWGDIDLITPQKRSENKLLAELGFSNKKLILQYAGNMGPLQDIPNLLETIKLLKHHEDIHFIFIGSGKMQPWLIAQVESHQLTNVSVLGQRDRTDQCNFLNACDVGIVSLVKGMAGVGVPSRLYNVMAAGKPVLAVLDLEAEASQVVLEEKIGWWTIPSDPKSLAKMIENISENITSLSSMGSYARDIVEKKYSYEKIVEHYREMFCKL